MKFISKYIARRLASMYLIFAIIALGLSIYGIKRELKPPIKISTLEDLNNNLGKKVELLANRIVDTGIGVEITDNNATTTYYYYLTKLDSKDIVLATDKLEQLQNVKIIGTVANVNSPVAIGAAGRGYEYFRSRYVPLGDDYNPYGITVYSSNIIYLDIAFAVATVVLFTLSIVSFRSKN